MKNKNVKIILSYVLVLLWMIVIFLFSSETGDQSGKSSEGLINNTITVVDTTLVNIHVKKAPIEVDKKEQLIKKLNIPVRKLAHFTEYLILCILWLHALKESKQKHKMILAISLSILYAMGDEFHQTFISERAGQITDVFIDSFGVFIGSIFYKLYEKRRKKV